MAVFLKFAATIAKLWIAGVRILTDHTLLRALAAPGTDMKPPQTKPTLFFRLIVPATVLFILTILALIAVIFGDPRAPVAQWLDAHGNHLLLGEFVAIVVLSGLAMTVDRMRTLRGVDEEPVRTSAQPEAD